MSDSKILPWTGERLVTEVNNEDTIYHLHRYALPLEYIKDKVVVDIASGEGYGSNLLADSAKQVYGVDISKEAVDFSNHKYREKKNLSFIEGRVENIPLENAIADVVVSFETLEHTDKHHEMMREVIRILKPDGIFIISSPDKANYSDRFDRKNEFHIKELYFQEFKALINQYFAHSAFYYQTFITGSFIVKENFSTNSITEYAGDYTKITSNKSLSFPMFNLAVASPVAIDLPEGSYFNGTDIMRDKYYDQVMGFTPYRLGNSILKPLRWLKTLFR